MHIELQGALEQAILARLHAGSYESAEEVIAEAIMAAPSESDQPSEDLMSPGEKQALMEFLSKMKSLSADQPHVDDRICASVEHDRILYGDPPA